MISSTSIISSTCLSFLDVPADDDVDSLMQLKTRLGHMGFVCLICGQTCKEKGKMKRHMKSKHMRPVHYRCPTCDQLFVNRGFENHVRKYHPTWKGVALETFQVDG